MFQQDPWAGFEQVAAPATGQPRVIVPAAPRLATPLAPEQADAAVANTDQSYASANRTRAR